MMTDYDLFLSQKEFKQSIIRESGGKAPCSKSLLGQAPKIFVLPASKYIIINNAWKTFNI